ncbi:hypothetical protein BDQ17DRAFT_1366377 [Cyathus striatus]|nr:hypothetical protein BDQ17DRAFT_1366377 [Cyathus striatus]
MRNGDVDLSPLLNIYGIPNLQVIDPMRWTELVPARPYRLSPLAIEALRLNDSERGILVTETPVPFVTQSQRNIRIAYLICYFYAFSLFHLAIRGGLERKDVPVSLGSHYWTVYTFMVCTKDFVIENWEKVALTFIVIYLFFFC